MNRQSKAYWLEFISRRPHGLPVNTKYFPQLSQEKTLLQLVKEGKLVRTRVARGGKYCRMTVLTLAP